MTTLTDAWSWLTTAAHWSGENGVWQRLGEHLFLTVVCLALSCLVALPVALVLGHLGKGGALAVNLANAGRAVPTFAVLVLLLLSPSARTAGGRRSSRSSSSPCPRCSPTRTWGCAASTPTSYGPPGAWA